MTYHVARNNQQLGSYPKEELINLYNAGTILPTDLVWTEGMAGWESVSKVFGATATPSAPPAFAAPPPVTGVATPVSAAAAESRPAKPANYLVWSILTTLLCCLPLGIVAIIFAAQVDNKYQQGDYAGAVSASAKAKLFSIISAVVGGIVLVIYIAYMVFMVSAMSAGAGGSGY